ncbi:hypothetical protein ADK53_13845 [Streptomyces sp. WM6373]|uniref:hypothetical protein n=1 Tax=Streptomyces TaxID=1883 RepID=UPI0006AF31E2|nr:hypothetical protein [Streptomyces sp. H021]KOU36000.1 hypothetical protein ADK53_13845 [Streptomyces sp. WM6373]KOV33719.1 hypothetical protein ADK97_17815 [Streptomyces sp. H021]
MGFGGVGDGGGRGQASRGHVLLVAADAAVRRGRVLVAPGANVAALAMVPADVLLGCEVPADTVCLEGVRDPNTVLARLRAAVTATGPLFVYVSGRLTADRRGRRLFVALAGTTAGSVRYTSVPWDWLVGELRSRTWGVTTVVVDLVADKEAWPLVGDPGALPGLAELAGAEVFGVVCGPDVPLGDGGVSGYTRQWIDQLRRAPVRPSDVEVHVLAAGSAGLAPGTLVVPPARELEMRRVPAPAPGHPRREPEPVAVPAPAGPPPAVGVGVVEDDPRARLHALAVEGRHGEADVLARAWERGVVERWGRASAEAVRCAEIRADLARMAGDFVSATRLWVRAGRARLEWQGADAAEVRDAAAGALYCWTQVKDRAGALEAGPELVGLLRTLPLPDPGHLRLAERRLEALRTPDRSGALNP